MENLHKLIYTSNRLPICDEQAIQDILITAHVHNAKQNITGILLHSQERFLQYIEGRGQDIMDLYHSIEQDCRHDALFLHTYSPITERHFPSWKMAFKDLEGQLNFHTPFPVPSQDIFRKIIEGSCRDDIIEFQLLQLFFKAA